MKFLINYRGQYHLPCQNKDFGKKHLTALFTDGRIKVVKDGLPDLASTLLMEVKNGTNSFEDDRKSFLDKVDNLIRKAVA